MEKENKKNFKRLKSEIELGIKNLVYSLIAKNQPPSEEEKDFAPKHEENKTMIFERDFNIESHFPPETPKEYAQDSIMNFQNNSNVVGQKKSPSESVSQPTPESSKEYEQDNSDEPFVSNSIIPAQKQSQSNILSPLELEIQKAAELEKVLASKKDKNIWAYLEKSSLSNDDSFIYLGLVMDHDTIHIEKFLKHVKLGLNMIKLDFQLLVNILRDGDIDDIIKLMTIFALTEKVDKEKLDSTNIDNIINFFQMRFKEIYFGHEYHPYQNDLFVRRFLQFLNYSLKPNISESWKLSIDFWKMLLENSNTKQTFKYMFPALMNYLKFENRNKDGEMKKGQNQNSKKQESKSLISCILSRQKEIKFTIDDEFFWTHKDWISLYIEFYFQKIENGESLDWKIQEAGMSSSLSVFVSYLENINFKGILYIIQNSNLINIFGFSRLCTENIYNLLIKIVNIQLTTKLYNPKFLKRYFKWVLNVPNVYEVAKALKISEQLILYSCISEKFNSYIKDHILNYAANFFTNYYECGIAGYMRDGNEALEVFNLLSRHLPSVWERINGIINQKKQNPIDSVNLMIDKESFIKKLAGICNHTSQIAIPKEFTKFIGSLIKYLKTGEDKYIKSIENIVFSFNKEFDISSEDYNNNNYWASVLIEYCWESKIWISLKLYWINERKKEDMKNEQKKKEEIKENKWGSEFKNDFKNKRKNTSTSSESDTDYCCFSLLDNINDTNSQNVINNELGEKRNYIINIIESIIENIIENASALKNTEPITKSDIDLNANLLEQLKNSFVLQVLFEDQAPVQVKKWIISQLSNLFSVSIKNAQENSNFIMKTASFVMQLISKPIIKPMQGYIDTFKELAKSNVVKEGLEKINLYIDPTKNYEYCVYFANLPFDLAGVTVFGGDILINIRYHADIPFNRCAQNVIFAHELAHHVRQTKNGFYDINEKTPHYKKSINKGASGAEKSTKLSYTNKGGWQLESKIFSVFLVKICATQIDYLNNTSNWYLPVKTFKAELKKLYSENSNKYQLGRAADGLYYFERKGHNHN